MAEHFNLVNNSTMFGNYNSGRVIDQSRYNMMEKMPNQFSKNKKIKFNYNNENKFDTQSDVSNFAANQLQQIGYDFGFIHERGTDVIDRVVFYDPAGSPISDLKWSNALDLTTIALPIYMEHLNATGMWNGSDYVGLEDELDWEDLYNDLYGDVDPSDMDPEGGYGTTDYTGFDYSGVQNAPEYQNPEYDVDTAGAGFKEYLDKEFGGGAGSIQAALLAAGTPEEQLEIFGYDPTAGQITTSGLDALFLGIAQENIKKAMFKGILD